MALLVEYWAGSELDASEYSTVTTMVKVTSISDVYLTVGLKASRAVTSRNLWRACDSYIFRIEKYGNTRSLRELTLHLS